MAREKICGIYKIENLINGKVYVGQSVDVFNRWKQHQNQLENNTHYNTHLLRAYNKYGVENFQYELLEECDLHSLNEREMYWISHYDSLNSGYNQTSGGDGTNGIIKRVILLNTKEVFDNPKAAAEQYDISSSAIGMCCRGVIKCAGKLPNDNRLFWMYYKQYELLSDDERVAIEVQIKTKSYNKCSHTGTRVALLNTGEVFENMSKAADKYGSNITGIKSCCDYKFTFSGINHVTGEKYVWAYFDEYVNFTREEIRSLLYKAYEPADRNHEARMRKVVLLNTGEIFDSAKSASVTYNISHPTRITACCRHPELGYVGKNANGDKLYWRYHDDVSDLSETELRKLFVKTSTTNHYHKRGVVLLNTSEIFESIKAACEKYGLNSPNVIKACKTGNAAGKDSDTGEYFHWMYYDEYLEAKPNGNETVA